MQEKPSSHYLIVMEKVPDDRQPETALYLSGCFSLPPPSTRNIVASGPIALLSDLTRAQAEAILTELRPSLPPEVVLRLAEASESLRISRLQWPRPPRIYGRDVNDFALVADAHEVACPLCGGQLRITKDADGVRVAAGAGGKKKEDAASRKAQLSNDADPLFSGIKPLAAGSGGYASIRSLQAGDTGFWLDHGRGMPRQPQSERLTLERQEEKGTTTVKRSTTKSAAGLAAFMKPGAFAVVVGRTRDAAAVKMIAEIMGLGEGEARERSQNLGLCVARDISLNEAQNLLARFKKLGARARIVKPS